MSKIPSKYRKLVYVVALVVSVGAFAAGIINPEQVEAGVRVTGQVVATIAAVLALLNVSPDPEPYVTEGEEVELEVK